MGKAGELKSELKYLVTITFVEQRVLEWFTDHHTNRENAPTLYWAMPDKIDASEGKSCWLNIYNPQKL